MTTCRSAISACAPLYLSHSFLSLRVFASASSCKLPYRSSIPSRASSSASCIRCRSSSCEMGGEMGGEVRGEVR